MSQFVLDNSVVMRWVLGSENQSDDRYADAVLRSLSDASAIAPGLWPLEVANVLVVAERHDDITPAETDNFLLQLDSLPIDVDPLTARQALSHTLLLARDHKLTAYDASYLELSLRTGLPLATLDKDLLRATTNAGVCRYEPETS